VNSGPDGVDQTWASEGGSGEPAETLSADPKSAVLAELYLRACTAGAPCDDLAVALANAVLDSEVVRLALEVLDSEQHRHAKATELASRLLETTNTQFAAQGQGHG